MTKDERKVFAAAIFSIVLLGFVMFLQQVRLVRAEDDCAMPTWQVVRVSDHAVACIWEG